LQLNRPALSIGIPVYNGERYLSKTLDSLLAQTARDFEIIISDNASTDATEEVCAAYARRDARIRYIRQRANIGAPKNWNFVAEEAAGKYFKWASANDLYDPSFLAKCIAVLDTDETVVLCYSDTVLIDEHGTKISNCDDALNVGSSDPFERFRDLLMNIGLNNAQAGVIRTDALLRTRLEGPYPGSDIPLMADLCLRGKFRRIAEPLFFRRMSPDAATQLATRNGVQQFFDPNAAIPLYLHWPFHIDLARAVFGAPLPLGARTRCLMFSVRLMYWRRKALAAETFQILRGRGSWAER
jgi:glycosyltransferase involved in cell wall biosynthesis